MNDEFLEVRSQLKENLKELNTIIRENKSKEDGEVKIRKAFEDFFNNLIPQDRPIKGAYFPTINIALTLNQFGFGRYALVLWGTWGKSRKHETKERTKAIDSFAVQILKVLDDDILKKIHDDTEEATSPPTGVPMLWRMYELPRIAETLYSKDPEMLEDISLILEKLGEADWDQNLVSRGKTLRAQAAIQRAKEPLKNEFLESVNEKVASSKVTIQEELNRKLSESKIELDNRLNSIKDALAVLIPETETKIDKKLIESEHKQTRNFVQIIGIFAAIIAFVVTMVPASIRLGGASIPVALAGLAIVTAGIIVLLAMIFGKDERRKSLSKGLTGIIIAFILWLTLTVVLAFVKPNVLAPPERVDTLYIDTVESTPPPTPSIEEGE